MTLVYNTLNTLQQNDDKMLIIFFFHFWPIFRLSVCVGLFIQRWYKIRDLNGITTPSLQEFPTVGSYWIWNGHVNTFTWCDIFGETFRSRILVLQELGSTLRICWKFFLAKTIISKQLHWVFYVLVQFTSRQHVKKQLLRWKNYATTGAKCLQ